MADGPKKEYQTPKIITEKKLKLSSEKCETQEAIIKETYPKGLKDQIRDAVLESFTEADYLSRCSEGEVAATMELVYKAIDKFRKFITKRKEMDGGYAYIESIIKAGPGSILTHLNLRDVLPFNFDFKVRDGAPLVPIYKKISEKLSELPDMEEYLQSLEKN